MKRGTLIIVTSLFLAIVLLSYWASQKAKLPDVKFLTAPLSATPATTSLSNSAPTNTRAPDQQQKEAVAAINKIFSAPIVFFGKVQDQNGRPISGAKIDFGAVDKFWEPGSNYQSMSDADGLFSITGIQGAGLTVGVSKQGYDGINGLSYQSFGYGMPPDSNRKAPPRKEDPAIFVLRKKGDADPLIVVHRDTQIPKNGTPVDVSLKTGKPVEAGHGDLKIECWTSDNLKDASGHYEWHARVSVPGGGLTRRTEPDLDFTAPESGYEPALEIAMPQNVEPWRRDSDGQYWVKLGNGTFARMRFRITTAGDHFASITSYLNPSGSRNLEYDEEKVIR